ncbi:hypothetical protein F5B20DRAFT_559594 [Whalleya microplaca]|nr:hypothetical protein F5B20DRAFT_559594 [Whalleya microplaca]
MDSTQSQLYQQPAPIIPFSKSWHITKIVLTFLSIIFCIIVLGISIALAVNPHILSYIAIWTAPQAGVALIWSIAELITICVRRSHQGIHPSAHVALHLLLGLGFSTGLGLTAYILAFGLAFSSDDTKYHSYFDYYYDDKYYYEYYSKMYLKSMEALVAFLGLLIIVHFLLFLRACVETAKRDSMRRQVIMMPPQHMYYAPSMHPGVPMQPLEAHLPTGYVPEKGAQDYMAGSSIGHVQQPPVAATRYETGQQLT